MSIQPMQIRAAGRWIGFTILLAALVHVATVWLIPQRVMSRTLDRASENAGINQLYHAPRVTAESRSIVRPSPDLAYSVCAFDLSRAPIRLAVPRAADYISIAGYADNTDNFMVVNNTAFPEAGWNGWIATEPQASSMQGNVVISPSSKGIVLIRRLVRSPDGWPAVNSERDQMSCVSEGG